MFKHLSPQPTMREFLSSCISMRNSRLLVLLISLFCLSQGALAQEDNREAYAVLDANGLLKFYYDTNKSDASASGTVYDVPWYEDPGWITWDNENMDYFENKVITSVAFDISFREYNLESANAMFASCTALESIDFTNFNTSNVKNMSGMFYYCNSLTALVLSGFDTRNVTDMSYMFCGCSALKEIDLSTFDTKNVLYMYDMFDGCTSLQTLDLLNFNTSNVLYMSNMFSSCSSLQTLNLSNFDTSNVLYMSNMFFGCSGLETLNISNFNTENVNDMEEMFSGCSNLQTLDLTSFNTSNVGDMEYMFSGCSNLQTLDLTSFNTSNVGDMEYMFSGCTNLTTIYCNNDWYKDIVQAGGVIESDNMFTDCTQLVGAIAYSGYNENDVDFANPTTGYFTYGLRDYAENSSLLDRIEDMPRVGLVGRTLYKTGDWNTLCLPFSVEDSNPNDGLTFSGTPLEGATVMTLDNSENSGTGFDPSSGILTLNFVEVNYIEAGDPYIIKWNSGENIVNPTFTGVTISSTAGSFGASGVSFIGIYDPLPLTSANSNILYLGAGNTLYYPSANMTINSFRAYFELNLTSAQQVKAINLNFGDEEAASIKTISESSDHSESSDAYFSLDGRRLNDKPATAGLYIINGKKVVIK